MVYLVLDETLDVKDVILKVQHSWLQCLSRTIYCLLL